MRFNLGNNFEKKWMRNSIYLFSIFCVVHYVSDSIHNYNYYSFIVFVSCIAVSFIFTLFNLNIKDDKNERT